MALPEGVETLISKLDLEEKEGAKHTIFTLRVAGKYIGQFGISRSSKEKKTPPYVASQLKLNNTLVKDIIACNSGLGEVEEHLRSSGQLD